MADGYATGRRLAQEDARLMESIRASRAAEAARREEAAMRERQRRGGGTHSGDAAERRRQQDFENRLRTDQADFERRKYADGQERQRWLDDVSVIQMDRQNAWDDAARTQEWDMNERKLAAADIQNEDARAQLDEYLRVMDEAKAAKEKRGQMIKTGLAAVMYSAMEHGKFADPSAIRFFNNQNRDGGMQIDTSVGAYFEDGKFVVNIATPEGPKRVVFDDETAKAVKSVWREAYGIKDGERKAQQSEASKTEKAQFDQAKAAATFAQNESKRLGAELENIRKILSNPRTGEALRAQTERERDRILKRIGIHEDTLSRFTEKYGISLGGDGGNNPHSHGGDSSQGAQAAFGGATIWQNPNKPK